MAGNGIYKIGPTQAINDQANGIAGQVVTLVTGGLTPDAQIGWACTFDTSGNTYTISDNAAGTVTLIGDISGENTTDTLTIDKCTTTAAADTLLYADQGGSAFAAEQTFQYEAGQTYSEAITFTANLTPTSRYRLVLERDGASGTATLDLGAGTYGLQQGYVEFLRLRNLTITCSGTVSVYLVKGTNLHLDHVMSTGSSSYFCQVNYDGQVLAEDCDLGSGHGYGFLCSSSARGQNVMLRRVSGSLTGAMIRVNHRQYGMIDCESVECSGNFLTFGTGEGGTAVRLANCVAYGGMLIKATDAAYNLDSITVLNCIANGGTYAYQLAAGAADAMNIQHNCYHGQSTAIASYAGGDKTFAQWQTLGYDDDTQAPGLNLDPKFVDGGNGDFDLAIDSPCVNAGAGAGVTTDRNGNTFDRFRPSMGSRANREGNPTRPLARVGLNGGIICV